MTAKPRRLPAVLPESKSPPRTARAAHAVRIVGGQWKRTRLPVPDSPGLRPTPDRVRETLFNWLGQDLAGWRVLDAFAGTGALGLEAASRGASCVWLVEQDRALAAGLRMQVGRLHAQASVQVRHGDGVAALRAQAAGSLDLALLDPPFSGFADALGQARGHARGAANPMPGGLCAAALAAAAQAVRAGGFVYLESPAPWPADDLPRHALAAHRHLKAGQVHAQLLLKLPQGGGVQP